MMIRTTEHIVRTYKPGIGFADPEKEEGCM